MSMMSINNSRRRATLGTTSTGILTGRLLSGCCLLGAVSLLSSCSAPGEDVRVRLCKDLVAVQLGTDQLSWTQISTATPGYDDARISLRWSGPNGEGSAACAYRYNAVDDTAQQLADPLSAYATSPRELVINGQPVSASALANAIAQAMKRQGRELIEATGKAFGQ
jgi:hypothetical protein